MNDLISRKAAIKAIRKDMYADKDFMSAMICEGIEYMLNGVPSAEPERKKPDHGYMWICPGCGLEVHSDFARCVRCGWEKTSADLTCDGCMTPKHICGICMRNYPNITDHYCRGEWAEDEEEHTMEEFMYGQDMGSEEDGSL